ncbi:MAG: hypothetical protein WEF50_20020 [Myxococcota bacterium]
MHKLELRWLSRAALLAAVLVAPSARASDHADPMSLNVFEVQGEPEANITDLHAFIVDEFGLPGRLEPLAKGNRLVISLCVRRSLRPDEAELLDLAPYRFRVHLDLAPSVRFVDEKAAAGKTGAALVAAQRDLSMQALYGGVITHPERIVERALLEFDLRLARETDPSAELKGARAWGFLKGTQVEEVPFGQRPKDAKHIWVTAGLFDDPFIFPRFFRRNVVGVVASIPLDRVASRWPDGTAPIVLWATTHADGKQIDHDGRSLRTQLPRFGHLNDKPPSAQERAIARVHAEPTLVEALLGSIVAPLFAHRHYDSVPDVMIYDLRKPARFPNGRRLEDDVAKTLADAGETLLLELAYAESREFPRATRNDKEFRPDFPYLAEKWSQEEIDDANHEFGIVPRAPDADAIAPVTLDDSIWRKLHRFELLAIAVLTAGVVLTVRSTALRAALVVLALLVAATLSPISAPNVRPPVAGALEQPGAKLARVGLGLGLIVPLLLGWIFALGRRFAGRRAPEPRFPRGRQGPIADDARSSSHDEIHRALFDRKLSRPYYCEVWPGSSGDALPLYPTTFASITEDLFGWRARPFAMERAARRTLATRADLRWGADRNGFRRLVHPMGVCLAGTWKIDASPTRARYTGYFAPGAEGRVIARYSLGGNHPEGGRARSLGLVGKVFPTSRSGDANAPRAHFITQEDLGGVVTDSIAQAVLTNSPPVTLLNRGRGLFAFLFVIVALRRADVQPAERQLYELAELEKPDDVQTLCPRFLRLTIVGPPLRDASGSPSTDEPVDFRHEILGRIYDAGDSAPKRKLEFAIEVSDIGRRTLLQDVIVEGWTRIGTLAFDEAAASYNGDFVVHFHHPPWRVDRNDPGSVKRRKLRS